MGLYAWTLRVTSPDRQTARVASGRRQFAVTRPLDFDAEHEGITALEYALGALGAELVTGIRELAKRRRLDVEDIEAVVVGELDNPLTYLEVVGEEGHPGISRVQVKIYVASSEREATVRGFVQQAIELLPLARTFRSLVRLELHVMPTP
jgi:hypothetical protein